MRPMMTIGNGAGGSASAGRTGMLLKSKEK